MLQIAHALGYRLIAMWVISSLILHYQRCFEWGARIQIVELRMGDLNNDTERRELEAWITGGETKRKPIIPQWAIYPVNQVSVPGSMQRARETARNTERACNLAIISFLWNLGEHREIRQVRIGKWPREHRTSEFVIEGYSSDNDIVSVGPQVKKCNLLDSEINLHAEESPSSIITLLKRLIHPLKIFVKFLPLNSPTIGSHVGDKLLCLGWKYSSIQQIPTEHLLCVQYSRGNVLAERAISGAR